MLVKLFYKYGMIYREVMASKKIDVCSLAGQLKSGKFFVNKLLVQIAQDAAPGVIHECPYNVSRHWI